MNKESLPVLISFAYADCFDWEKVRVMSPAFDLLVDCGAFTVHKKGKVIQLSEYYDFLYKIDFPIVDYFALDSIGDPVKTFSNFMQMKDDGFDPMPIFTRGDNLERLEEYYKYSDIVALGGLWAGGENDPGYVKYIMEEGFRGRKTHWLGFAVHNLMLYYKPFSVDTSNWKTGLRFANLFLFDGLRSVKISKEQFRQPKTFLKYADMIQKMGFDPQRLQQEAAWRGQITYAHLVNCKSYLNYAERLRSAGIKHYFVCNWDYELFMLLMLQRNNFNFFIDIMDQPKFENRFRCPDLQTIVKYIY